MSLLFTEEQSLLKESAAAFVQGKRDLNALRVRRSSPGVPHFDREIWSEMVELGWAAIPFEEAWGGLGLGFAELGIVMEELGRGLVPSPLLSTVVLYGGVIEIAGSSEHKRRILPEVIAGNRLGSFAYLESARHDPLHVETTLKSQLDGYRLTGCKNLVLDGGSADEFVVLAREEGQPGDDDGLRLVLVPADSEGIELENYLLIDGRSASNVHFREVVVEDDWLLTGAGPVAGVLDQVFDRAAVTLSAEMIGGIQSVFDMTIEYLKVREQFGAKIGSFQGLKHRAARWFCEVELSKAIVLKALRAIDENSAETLQIASACKARLSDTAQLSGKEGIQMHGGIGVTDEHDVGLFMKHGRVAEMMFGDSRFHQLRFASSNGY
jgi:alkylation response protein AidB-like acyl-CoA dehydrogenase